MSVIVEGLASTALEDLLERVQSGDRVAFAALYRLTSPRVFGLIRQILRDPAQSEEVSQEVYLEIWQTALRFDRSKGTCLSWMFTLAHRRAVDRVRASQASRARDLKIGVRNLEREFDSVAERVEVIFESERMREAMSALSAVQRQAVELTYFGGYSMAEVATRVGIPPGTAKTRVRDGLLKLRTALAEAPPVEEAGSPPRLRALEAIASLTAMTDSTFEPDADARPADLLATLNASPSSGR